MNLLSLFKKQEVVTEQVEPTEPIKSKGLDVSGLISVVIGMCIFVIGTTLMGFLESIDEYDKYYKQYKDPVLHRILKQWMRKSISPSKGLRDMADFRVRMYQRIDSEVESYF